MELAILGIAVVVALLIGLVFAILNALSSRAAAEGARSAAARASQHAAAAEHRAGTAEQRGFALEQRAVAAEQRAGIAEHRASGSEQRAVAAEQRAAGAELRAVRAEQQAAFLSKYQAIVDVEATVAQMRAQAEQAARQVDSLARQHAERLLANATTAKEAVEAEGKRMLDEARARVEQSNLEASRLEAAVRALRNITEGYGDAYILPTAGLLDDLAEAFGYTEAGANLKAARKATQNMVKAGTAAESGYVEASRRADAIRFIVDAFNGKVDTILADAKRENHGKLAEKIRDAYALVNLNGAAFRATRITPRYLDARLEELKWAVIAIELREREREEQRELKEKVRDEERAQKEFERVQKEAEKEEEMLRKALDKARREVEQSSEADRAAFQSKLQELAEKLKAAEEKGQRAMSMAQQTKVGHVYVISNVGSFGEHVYKIGMTRRLQPEERVRELGDASVPFEFDIHALVHTEDAPALECALHKTFAAHQINKVNPRKEFFRVNLEAIRGEVERLGIGVSWTMTAACREYQESLAMQRAADAEAPSGTQLKVEQATTRADGAPLASAGTFAR